MIIWIGITHIDSITSAQLHNHMSYTVYIPEQIDIQQILADQALSDDPLDPDKLAYLISLFTTPNHSRNDISWGIGDSGGE